MSLKCGDEVRVSLFLKRIDALDAIIHLFFGAKGILHFNSSLYHFTQANRILSSDCPLTEPKCSRSSRKKL